MKLGIKDIKKVIPHREPFLLLDEIIEADQNHADAVYTFRPDNPVFSGHFPTDPIVPGVLLLECMAQAGAYCLLSFCPGRNAYMTKIDNAKFKRPVRPGEQLKIHAEARTGLLNILKSYATVTVNGELAAECEITCALV